MVIHIGLSDFGISALSFYILIDIILLIAFVIRYLAIIITRKSFDISYDDTMAYIGLTAAIINGFALVLLATYYISTFF